MCLYGENGILITDLSANKVMRRKRDDFSFDGLVLQNVLLDKPNCICTDPQKNIYVGEVGDDSRKLTCFNENMEEVFRITQVKLNQT